VLACDTNLVYDIALTNAGPIVVYSDGLTGPTNKLMTARP